MPRRARQTPGGLIYHVFNRAVGRMRIFSKPKDYSAFQQVLIEAQSRVHVPLLAYCIMPNHWHLVLAPREDGDLSKLMHWLTMTHTQRWRHLRKLVGLGPLYQGRFKAFPVQDDIHLLTVLRYTERNPLRAGLVARAEDWQFSSLFDRLNSSAPTSAILHTWPIDVPKDYIDLINRPQTAAEEEAMRVSIRRGRPFGDEAWQKRAIKRLGLESSMNPAHRPRQP